MRRAFFRVSVHSVKPNTPIHTNTRSYRCQFDCIQVGVCSMRLFLVWRLHLFVSTVRNVWNLSYLFYSSTTTHVRWNNAAIVAVSVLRHRQKQKIWFSVHAIAIAVHRWNHFLFKFSRKEILLAFVNVFSSVTFFWCVIPMTIFSHRICEWFFFFQSATFQVPYVVPHKWNINHVPRCAHRYKMYGA